MANLNVNIAQAIEPIEQQLTDINRRQLLLSVGGDGRPLINQLTGSPKLSPLYARRTNKTYPNIKLTGDYQSEMFMHINEQDLTGAFTSNDWKVNVLAKMYPNLHGIAPVNSSLFYGITHNAVRNYYKKSIGL